MRASPRWYVPLIVSIAAVPAITAFLVSPSLQPKPFDGVHHQQSSFVTTKTPRGKCRLYFREMDSTNAFQVLNLDSTADEKEIRHAYKRMALRYHPDVVTNKDTPPEQKRRANDIFAKINWAYAQLSNKDGATSSTTSPSTGTSTSTSSSSSSYEYTPPHRPPHRRTSASSTYNSNQAFSRSTSSPYSSGVNSYSSTKGTPSNPNQASPKTTPHSPGAPSHSSTRGTSTSPNQASSRSTNYPYSPEDASYSSTSGTSSSGSKASSPSAHSSEKDAWIHEEFCSNYRGRGSDTRSTARSSQRQPYSLYTPPPPPRQESDSTRGTYSNGSTFYTGKETNTREQQLEDDGVQNAESTWTVRLKADKTDHSLSLAEKEILKAATWAFEFSFRQRAHCIASRMLDEYLNNPERDESSPPVPNPENPAEAVALKLVEFSPPSKLKQTEQDGQTVSSTKLRILSM